MQIQVNSGNNVEMNRELNELIQQEIGRTLQRFEDRLTRLEVHVNDHNSDKGGAQDKSCVIEARPNGLDPVSASHNAGTAEESVRGAAEKLERVLDSLFGRLSDRR